jgi:xylulokinase
MGATVKADPPYVLGLDMGTSTVKAALFNADGVQIGLQSDEYLLTPDHEVVENDPETYWSPVVRAVRKLLKEFPGRPEQIVAVSTSTFGESIFPMAADGSPTRPSVSWMDNRSAPEAQAFVERVGLPALQSASGQGDIGPLWPATKFLWMARSEPDVFRRTAKFLLPDDYLLFRLSGEMVAEETMWGSSLVMDIRRKVWSEPLMEAAGVTPEKLPPLTPTCTVIGRVSQACAEATGLSTETKVVSGAMDQMCAAVGAGNIVPGIITESAGSVVALLTTTREPIIDFATKVPCHIHAVPGMYCLLAWSPTGGLVLKWFKDRFGEEEKQRAAQTGTDVYDVLCEEASHVQAGSDGLTMLPYLEGSGFPEFVPSARGVLFGLSLRHGKPHIIRSILEAIAYLIKADVDVLQSLGAGADEVRVIGGGAKSALWNQIKADVLGLPIAVPANREAAVLGAAIIAAVGAGLHRDFPTAVEAMTRMGDRIQPDAANHTVYAEGYRRYRRLFEHVTELF